jgi:hypothetical protein
MSIIDFANSYMTWFPRGPGNLARIQLDAACTLQDEGAGTTQHFYLIAPCRAERMYVETPLFQLPNYEFCAIWSADEFLILRTHWVSERDNREYGLNNQRWERVQLDIRHFPQSQPLRDEAAIVRATLTNLPLVARTILADPLRKMRVILEYPVKTMNVMLDPPRFQVDTGPLIVPDLASTAQRAIERFETAHIVYNNFGKAEFILRQPVPLAEPKTDYCTVQVMPAQHELWCAG